MGARGKPTVPFKLKYAKQVAEFEAIAKVFDTHFRVSGADGRTVALTRKLGPHKHFGTILLETVGWKNLRSNDVRQVPEIIKNETKENIKIFLEAYFSLYAHITASTLRVNTRYISLSQDLQELLLYFGIESKIIRQYDTDMDIWKHELELRDYRAYYRFFQTFNLPGIAVRDLPEPPADDDPSDWFRFEKIQILSLDTDRLRQTYAVTVWEDPNYISDNVLVHNSLVLEDKIIWESINPDLAFPETKEQVLMTANTAQMTPILDRLVLRFMNSPLLKDFLQGNINRSKGTLDFPLGTSNYRFNARIAGTGSSNVVGLHVPKIKIDESQLFPMNAYIQLLP